MSRNWTEQQKNAIASRDGSILVSAAAGSGKTAVLVERVIERITDKEKPCPANDLLIVTFTKAAAGEMRERIYKALQDKIRSDPGNGYIREQEMLLPDAEISTMDSFCNSLVKENFRLLDISPDFKIIDDNELSLLESSAIDTVMESEYQKGDRAFLDLVELLFKDRDDAAIAECVKKLYSYSRAYAFPDEWLDGVVDGYDPSVDISRDRWGQAILDYAVQAAEYCLELNSEMFDIISEGNGIFDFLYETCVADREKLCRLLDMLESGDWDGARSETSNSFARKKNTPKEMKEDPTVILLDKKRNIIKETVSEKIQGYMCVSEEENAADSEFFRPMVKKLIECVKLFDSELMSLKKEKNGYTFSDISHMALCLLVKKQDGEIVKTPLAEELSDRYVEILIDEYQDTNEEQHILFNSLSRDGTNLFRVGDVKQSIYSFRQAMPEIFTGLRDKLDEYDGTFYPAKITLDKNFRSREGVTSFINFVFSQLMSREAGGIEYDKNEELVAGAVYPETNRVQAQLHIIDRSANGLKDLDSAVCQARHIASLVKDMVSNEKLVGRPGSQRPIKYKDICILMRSVKSDSAVALADELRMWGIPCFTEVTGNFFSSSEISVMLSILRVIDNPNQDVPLLSALMSPIFAFTPDETAKMRINNRKASIYSCLLENEDKDEKVANFLKFIRRMRFIASTSTASELIRRILDETSYLAIVQAMQGGDLRRSNLMLLTDYAEVYESSGMIGLSGFIRFIDRLFINQKELDASNPISENADVVKIMTIHKSKGLEFPVCILADANKQFNIVDLKKNMIINPRYGIGLIRRDARTMAEYETLSHMSAKLQADLALKSEEMRILYVAMTRAEEELIAVSSERDAQRALENAASDLNPRRKKQLPFAVFSEKSFGDWLMKAALRHPDSFELRKAVGLGEEYALSCDSRLEVKIIDSVKSYTAAVTDVSGDEEIDGELQKLIDERVNYEYIYAPLASVATKMAASQLDGKLIDRENFASSKPDFMSDGKLTATQKGTATHRFMQYADFRAAEKDISSEAERLVLSGKLTEDEAKNIRQDEIEKFFRSELYGRIKRSYNVMREKKFTVSVPAEKVYPELKGELNEDVMIQGMIDCAFEENGKFVVVDYKTDRMTDEEDYRAEYTEQLKMYKYALEQITDLEVSETCVYSFRLSKTVEIF